MAADWAMIAGPCLPRRSWFSCSNLRYARTAPASSIWLRTIASSRRFSQGFAMKSRAPRRMASTASSTLAQAVMITTGSVGSSACRRLRRSRPSFPLVVSRA